MSTLLSSSTSASGPWALAAGAAGGVTYLLGQSLDIAVTGEQTNDLKLLGMMITRKKAWLPIGLLMHFSFAMFLGGVYSRTLDRWLPWPGWLKGIIFANIENTVLWFLLIGLVDRWHPAIKQGILPPYNRPVPFWQGVWRHVAFGTGLGVAYTLGRKVRS